MTLPIKMPEVEKKNALKKLSTCEIFSHLSQQQIESLEPFVEFSENKKGDIIFSPGDTRDRFRLVLEGRISLEVKEPHAAANAVNFNNMAHDEVFNSYGKGHFFGEAAMMQSGMKHCTQAKALEDCKFLLLRREKFNSFLQQHPETAGTIQMAACQYILGRVHKRSQLEAVTLGYTSGKFRLEHDLLGDRNVPQESYFGCQTLRACENFNITGITLKNFPIFIRAFAEVKKAAALANERLGILEPEKSGFIQQACDELIDGRLHEHFVVDMIQGGAGTSTNMNVNEVIANRALELAGFEKGAYDFIHPNNHVNLSQSTNDAYPTAVRVATLHSIPQLTQCIEMLCTSLGKKAREFSDVLKMGRTQLQDAVPMTLGQEFEAFRINLEEEITRIKETSKIFLEVNLGGTAIGTGINAHPGYTAASVKFLKKVTNLPVVSSANLIEATPDTGSFVLFSGVLKRLAVKLSKLCNDLRLLSSGPRCGFGEINLPAMQPGSSIMPGKVNPVIPEVVNQVAFQVIGNDLTVTLASEAGQLQLNVMEPVIVFNIFQSVGMLVRAVKTLDTQCIRGITANREVCRQMVERSIGLVTALNPIIGYEQSTKIAKEALETGQSVFDLVLKHKLMSRQSLEEALKPENMLGQKL